MLSALLGCLECFFSVDEIECEQLWLSAQPYIALRKCSGGYAKKEHTYEHNPVITLQKSAIMLRQRPECKFSGLTLSNKKIRQKALFAGSGLGLCAVLSACSLGSTSDPVAFCPTTSDGAVVFVKRPLLFDEDDVNELLEDDLRRPESFRPGARLFLKGSTLPEAEAVDITSTVFSDPSFLNEDGELLYDVKDLSVSYDATQLAFAMRAPDIEGADEADQPKWNIWTYSFETCQLDRAIDSDTTAEAGHDISPDFLPDGRIVFSSTRQQIGKAILLDEGKPQYSALVDDNGLRNQDVAAFSLHVMDAETQDIQQISFNQSHDLYPEVMQDGMIVFSRWDDAPGSRSNGMNLYRVDPNGRNLEYLYGRHSHDSGDDGSDVQFYKPVESPNRGVIVQLREFQSQSRSTQPTEVDIDFFIESDQDTDGNPGIGQMPLISDLNTSGEPSLSGNYGLIFPLYDGTGRMLVSWSLCRVRAPLPDDAEPGAINTNPVELCTQEKLDNEDDYEVAPPLYGLWLRDGDAQRPIELAEEGFEFSDALLVQTRPMPTFIGQAALDSDQQALGDEGLGAIHIRSVYDIDGVDTSPAGIATLADPVQTPPNDRPIQFVRIEKPVSIPDEEIRDFQNSAYGVSRAQSMREILGYAPVEPDGSVNVAVPANVAFAISLLDINGRRLSSSPRHENWLSVAPGERLECKGCHTATSEVPHGRRNAGPDAVNQGATTTGIPFPNTEPALFADAGETMAQVYTRVNGLRRLTPNIQYSDEWTDENITPKAADFDYSYGDDTAAPIAQAACNTTWSSLCRVTVNYPEHIHPLWGLDRRVFEADLVTLIQDNTCTSCHSNVDAMDAAMVPVAQLDLSNGASDIEADHFKSYRELLSGDNQQEVVDGILRDVMVETGDFETDPDTGELVLDEDDNPIPILTTVPLNAPLNLNGANRNAAFFNLFASGGTHENYLTAGELKLISEWLDLGAQYWNDPFNPSVPVN